MALCSDSQYTLRGLGEWMPAWIKKGLAHVFRISSAEQRTLAGASQGIPWRARSLWNGFAAHNGHLKMSWRIDWQIEAFPRNALLAANECIVQESRTPEDRQGGLRRLPALHHWANTGRPWVLCDHSEPRVTDRGIRQNRPGSTGIAARHKPGPWLCGMFPEGAKDVRQIQV